MLLVIDYNTPKQPKDKSMIGHYYTHSDRLRANLGFCKTIKEGTLFGMDLDTNIRMLKLLPHLKIKAPSPCTTKILALGFHGGFESYTIKI
jgi:hypothetical protein